MEARGTWALLLLLSALLCSGGRDVHIRLLRYRKEAQGGHIGVTPILVVSIRFSIRNKFL